MALKPLKSPNFHLFDYNRSDSS